MLSTLDKDSIAYGLRQLKLDVGKPTEVPKQGETATAFILYEALDRQDLYKLHHFINELRQDIQVELRRTGNFVQLLFW